MRVLLIDVNYGIGSTGKLVRDLYAELNRTGHSAAVCYGRGPLVNEPDVHKISYDAETWAHAMLTRITGLTGVYSPFATRRLLTLLTEFGPDVVHIHEMHGYFVNIWPIVDYLKRMKVKTVWTFHCEFMYTGKCGYAYDCDKWLAECSQCPRLRDYPKSYFLDFTRKMFNDKKRLFADFNDLTIVTPSEWLADRVRRSFLGDKNVRVIRNGIDTDNVFHPRSSDHLKARHALTNEKVVLAVAPGLMGERKGGKWILELARRFEDQDIKFILVGVDELTREFGRNVIALGRTTNQVELAEYYSMADLFVICSSKENFPTTCIEALACGTPVVGFDEGGTKETAPSGYGIFVPYGDIDGLERAVRGALGEGSELKSRQECSLFGQRAYSQKNMVREYVELYAH